MPSFLHSSDIKMTEAAASSVYDSDEEPPFEEASAKFVWRLDPAESHSDFIIEIDSSPSERTQDSVQLDRYHVHKSALALGPRRSGYFAKLLQGVFSETSRGVCRILLDPVAAKAFPALLDFLYGAPQLECSTESATALHFMGQYFEIRRLRWQARQFWMTDLCLENCATYYQHAVLFGDERVLRRIQITLGSEKLLNVSLESHLLKVIDPSFLLTILQTADLVVADSTTLSSHTSKLIARVLEQCVALDDEDEEDSNEKDDHERSCVSAELFLQLTDRSYLPEIHVTAALKLLQLERKIVNPPGDTLTSLQQRCLQSLGKDWQLVPLQSGFMDTLRRVSTPILLTELLSHAFTHAKEMVSLQKAKIVAISTQNSTLTMSLQGKEEDIERLESSLRRKLISAQKWRASYEASELRIRELEDEIKRFRPLPKSEYQIGEGLSENAPNGISGSRDSIRFMLRRRGSDEVGPSSDHPLYYYAHDS
jgi:hypothetical protein